MSVVRSRGPNRNPLEVLFALRPQRNGSRREIRRGCSCRTRQVSERVSGESIMSASGALAVISIALSEKPVFTSGKPKTDIRLPAQEQSWEGGRLTTAFPRLVHSKGRDPWKTVASPNRPPIPNPRHDAPPSPPNCSPLPTVPSHERPRGGR